MEGYVCITHRKEWPCNESGHHLLSNWPGDVKKIMDNDK